VPVKKIRERAGLITIKAYVKTALITGLNREYQKYKMKKTSQTLSRRGFLICLLLALLFPAGLTRAADAPAEKIVRVACVGDSITYGSGIKDRQHDSYPAVLGRWLGTGWDVRNFGVSGATLLKKGDRPYFKQKDHEAAVAFAPDIVVIMLGTNDSKHRGDGSLEADNAVDNWQYKADYVPDYEELIAEFRKANPNVKVYLCLPTPCFPGRWGINDKTIHDEIIPLVRQVAQTDHAGIIDLNTVLADKSNLFPDTVHPNAEGARLMAVAVYQALTGKEVPADIK
jgi:lysophospholipase L1-like esterase